MKLKGKVAFITGFGSGLGQAIARHVRQRRRGGGRNLDDRSRRGERPLAMIEKVGGKALFWPGDVADSAQMKALIDQKRSSNSAASISSSTAPA